MYVCMYVCMYVFMYLCVCVCVDIHISFSGTSKLKIVYWYNPSMHNSERTSMTDMPHRIRHPLMAKSYLGRPRSCKYPH